MNFGDILDEWEKIKRERPPSSRASDDNAITMESWSEVNDMRDKDAEDSRGPRHEWEARRLAALRPQDVLDLHGMTADEASSAIRAFIESSSRRGLEKVLVIHGKGLHSEGEPVLKKTTRKALEAHPLAGRFGEASRIDGGSGAMWVMVRSG
jgi:DNA-nicking Smr family endonuclease